MSVSIEYDYARDSAEIYRRSFAIIRSEANLARFTPDEASVAVRVIHACGMVEIAHDLVFAPRLVEAARGALLAGAPIFCDSKMVANGITRAGRFLFPFLSAGRRAPRNRRPVFDMPLFATLLRSTIRASRQPTTALMPNATSIHFGPNQAPRARHKCRL